MIHHIADAHEWHFATIGDLHITLPLPIIIYAKDRGLEIFSSFRFFNENHEKIPYKGYALDAQEKIRALDETRKFYDLSLTKNVASMLISVFILVGILLTMAKCYINTPKAVPRGFRAFLELIICFVKDEIAIPNIGGKKV